MSAAEHNWYDTIQTPALVLDLERMQRNICDMRARVDALAVTLRPHMKTAKSLDVAREVVSQDEGITVSTLREAEYFAKAGYRDIFYAVAIAPQKLPLIAQLMQTGARILLAIDDAGVAAQVQARGRELGVRFTALIEIDSGEGRSGVSPDASSLLEIAAALQGQGAEPAGVFTHGGHSYSGRTPAEHAAVAEAERRSVTTAADRLRQAGYPCAIVSLGSTPTVQHAAHLQGVTEVRAGVYMLGDLFQAAIGGCKYDGIAVSVLTTVIGNHPQREQLVIDAGGLALSKDVSTSKLGPDGDMGFGQVAQADDGAPIDGLYVQTAYQEHGIIKSRSTLRHADFPIGRKLRILPNHACMTAAAYDCYHVIGQGGSIQAIWKRTNGW